MIKTETRTIDGQELDYTYSTLHVYIENENGVRYEEAYDLKNSGHMYTETNQLIDDEDMPEDEQRRWLNFLKEYEFFFGDRLYVYSKYKIVKACKGLEIWNQMKALMEENDLKDLFDAAIEFESTDEFFIKGIYFLIMNSEMTMLKIKEILDSCMK